MTQYFHLESRPHFDSYEETVEKTSFLIQDAIKRQMVSDVPICTFLSGGVDSSVVSAVCAAELKKQGKKLTTFSFDFIDNDKYFKANSFQPSQDRPYVDKMVSFLDSLTITISNVTTKCRRIYYTARWTHMTSHAWRILILPYSIFARKSAIPIRLY